MGPSLAEKKNVFVVYLELWLNWAFCTFVTHARGIHWSFITREFSVSSLERVIWLLCGHWIWGGRHRVRAREGKNSIRPVDPLLHLCYQMLGAVSDQMGVLRFSSVLALSTWTMSDLTGWELRSHKTAPPPGCHSPGQVITPATNQRFPQPPPPFNNLLKQLIELRKKKKRTQENSLLTGVTVYDKRIQLSNSQMEETHRARYGGKGTELPCPLWTFQPPTTSTCIPTLQLRFLMEAL